MSIFHISFVAILHTFNAIPYTIYSPHTIIPLASLLAISVCVFNLFASLSHWLLLAIPISVNFPFSHVVKELFFSIIPYISNSLFINFSKYINLAFNASDSFPSQSSSS